ncbi:MAG: Maf family protein [Methylococcales bacterium]
MTAQIILASASPRRRELLDQIAVSYIIHPADIDETAKPAENARDYVIRIAAEKSAACQSSVATKLPILAADTSVVINNIILGKPDNEAHAIEMLQQLSGNRHYVYSAVSFRSAKGMGDKIFHHQALSITEVNFRALGLKEIKAYWRTGEPEGKAGAYAIQGLASVFVESIKGSFSGVVGLPLFETAGLLSKQGIKTIT